MSLMDNTNNYGEFIDEKLTKLISHEFCFFFVALSVS